MVSDAVTKYKGKSLNKELFTGPDLLSLVSALLRFQNHKIVFVGDMEAVFRQVRVKTSDRDTLVPPCRFTFQRPNKN